MYVNTKIKELSTAEAHSNYHDINRRTHFFSSFKDIIEVYKTKRGKIKTTILAKGVKKLKTEFANCVLSSISLIKIAIQSET